MRLWATGDQVPARPCVVVATAESEVDAGALPYSHVADDGSVPVRAVQEQDAVVPLVGVALVALSVDLIGAGSKARDLVGPGRIGSPGLDTVARAVQGLHHHPCNRLVVRIGDGAGDGVRAVVGGSRGQ